MDIKQKTKEELEKRIQKIESFIAEKGIGSSYLARAKRIQRNINLVLAFGAVTTLVGLVAWVLYQGGEEEE
jgi:hypothetical protein